MLTADLVPVKISAGTIQPRWVHPDNHNALELAEQLITIFEGCRGQSRGALDRELEDCLGTGTAFQLHRGLAKLLLDRSEFETSSPRPPEELRRVVFEAAARHHVEGTQTSLEPGVALAEAAAELAMAPEDLSQALWADLKDEQILRGFEKTTARKLLERYNMALAQAILLRATELVFEIPSESPRRVRELFRSVRFHRLLHRVEGSATRGYRVTLDGPLSLFRSSQRYGLQMANFLPTLVALEKWKLSASIQWGKSRRPLAFELAPDRRLVSHRALRGQYRPEEIDWLIPKFEKLESEWKISTEAALVDLGGKGVLVPEFVFTHEPTGDVVYFEVFGFWRKAAVEERVRLLAQHGPPNLILAVSKDLRAGEEKPAELPDSVYVFRSHPIAREVLERLESMRSAGLTRPPSGAGPAASGARER